MDKIRYTHNEIVHNFKAANIVIPYLISKFQPKSILDVGCGIGTWISVAIKNNIPDSIGIDGEYIDKTMLKIPINNFKAIDLENNFDLKRSFDIVLCLEVAEHLKPEVANSFVNNLTRHSEIILFSAAIPNQGGQNHLNEQWLDYWVKKFESLNFTHIDIRGEFWNNSDIEWWYRQNMALFIKKGNKFESFKPNATPVNIVHPELFSHYVKKTNDFEKGRINIGKIIKILINKFTFK